MKILIDNGHGRETLGKRSPDGSLREYKWAREIASRLEQALKQKGLDAERIVKEENDVSLGERSRRVNSICQRLGTANVILISIHCNAAPPNDNKWHNARGWSVWTSVGKTKADALATEIWDAMNSRLSAYKATFSGVGNQKPMRADYSDGDPDFESNFWILRKTSCPAVLTENLFQDNEQDVAYLLSKQGKQTIVEAHVEGIVKYINTNKK